MRLRDNTESQRTIPQPLWQDYRSWRKGLDSAVSLAWSRNLAVLKEGGMFRSWQSCFCLPAFSSSRHSCSLLPPEAVLMPQCGGRQQEVQ